MLKYIYSEKENRIKKVNVQKILDSITGTHKYIYGIGRENIADEKEDMFLNAEDIYDDYKSCKETIINKKKKIIENHESFIKEKENELNDYDTPEEYRYELPEFSLEDDEMLILCNYEIGDGFYFYGITNDFDFGEYPIKILSRQITNFISEKSNSLAVINRNSTEEKLISNLIKMFNGAIVKYKMQKTETASGEYRIVDIDMDEFNENTKYICMDKPVMMISVNKSTLYPEPYMILTKMKDKDIYVRYTPRDDRKKLFIVDIPLKKFSDYIIEQINNTRNLIDKAKSEISELEKETEENKETAVKNKESGNNEEGTEVIYLGENGIERKVINGKTIGNSFWMLKDQTSADEWNVTCIQKDLCVEAEFNPYTECSEYSDILYKMQKEGKLSDETIFFIKKYEQEKNKFDEYKSELRMSCYTIRDLIKNVSE